MAVRSAGILLYRRGADGLDVWIAHMGGPFWARKQTQSWSVPKGEYLPDEEPLVAALREFAEQIGTPPPAVDYFELGAFRQPSGKIITVFAAESDFQPDGIVSNTFPLEWPRGSGIIQDFPEVDDARWVTETDARGKLVKGQLPILDALLQRLERH
ncbi:NUDIX domain-containing protein [Pseudarthrobacter sp. AL07]|uniref:NUDIX domain-containing protein n=1 Tax=unclassified Pseudarthrobacter TaxID=2647000 RepID=UPI00249B5F9B|nr:MULTISPECIES: NUDIX domain-containing protein [unclassified Pseudarthrobacter]MDI3194749.1 NUDIX domain-containing protein [Pseudarthrobacter sp. AL20]MDI3208807.1 NUDIX domain-containing protein [Pseudarthrobacter sp. AL07]